jgi:hypothetical protein
MWPTRLASIGSEQPMLKNPKILQQEYCNYAPDPSERNPLRVAQIGASGSGWGVGVASQEPERRNPTQGYSKQGFQLDPKPRGT